MKCASNAGVENCSLLADASLAQLVERRSCKAKVVSSSLTGGSTRILILLQSVIILSTILFVDAAGTVHVNRDNGSPLGLVKGVNQWQLF